MGLILKQLFQFIKLLNSDTGTNSLASGIAAGFILGMTPAFALQNIIIFVLLFVFRIQIGAVFISAFFFAFVAYILDPVFHFVGMSILQMGALEGIFTRLYNLPIVPFTRFNNSVVMGAGVVAFALSPLVFLLSRTLIVKYREKVLAKFQETKFWKAVKATSFYKWYYKYDQLYG